MISQGSNKVGASKVKGQKVFVGMSGGVDSSVSAALLKQAGYDVTGVFIKVWQPDWIECNWKEERLDAMRAAAHLDIPFITLDLEKEYKKDVIDYMIAEYAHGRTPNPDVMCNRYVKFGAFWTWALEHGAEYIATGHYARNQVLDNAFSMLAGVDTEKDQSYFLWTLNQNDLPHVLFPVGHLKKPEVRRLAKKFKLPNAEKKDSQGLCFIGHVDIKEFLSHYVKTEPGAVLNAQGERIGTHPGALFFTMGERHGFTIDNSRKSPTDTALYVIDKDVEKNTITVSDMQAKTGAVSRIRISRVNWVSGQAPDAHGTDLKARARYRAPLESIRLVESTLSDVTVEFGNPQPYLTPGQSLVIYRGDECLGGGIIDE